MPAVARTLRPSIAGLACCTLLVACTESPQAPEPPLLEKTVYVLLCVTPPDWVGFQDGDGAWLPASGVDGLYSFVTTSEEVGIAIARTIFGGRRTISVDYTTRDALTAGPDSACPERRPLSVDAVGITDGDHVLASLGGTFGQIASPAAAPVEVEVNTGPLDVIASRSPTDLGDQLDRILLLRSHEAGATLTLDFTGDDSFEPAPIDVTIQNLGPGRSRTAAYYNMGDMGQLGGLYFQEAATVAGTSRVLPGIPPDRQATNDVHAVRVITQDAVGAREALVYFHEARPVTIPLGPSIIPPTTFVAAEQPTFRPGVRFVPQVEYGRRWSVIWFHRTSRAPSMTVRASAAYLGSNPIELAVPDLSALPQWDPTWGFPSDELTYVVFAGSWSGGSPEEPTAGLTRQVATFGALF